jgi:phage tail sheath protein FI
MPTYKTPDVYVEEISTFPPSVAEVGTAIPAFVGYTEKAAAPGSAASLTLKPTKIYSLAEFEGNFGFPKADTIKIRITGDAAAGYKVAEVKVNDADPATALPSYPLYYAVKMYFDNGGGQCYIVSVGSHTEAIEDADLVAGLAAVALEDEPTLLVVPGAVKLANIAHYQSVITAMLNQCDTLKDRFAVIDLHAGKDDPATAAGNRNNLIGNLKYGAAYYPFLKTTMNHHIDAGETNVKVTENAAAEADLSTFKTSKTVAYNFVKAALKDYFVVMPPSGAVAGVYAAVDGARGVWKAPANVSLADVMEPVVKVDNLKQENLNVDPTTGKSINVLRAFAGKGTLVWGARTLAGNDNEWRYISVRRFFNMVEESVKKSTYWAVFEPNDANTWVKVRGMIENYLTDKWREGALAGATPKDAFFVKCGLGSTMTPQDVLEGRMNVEIGMAVVRPAEFIILKFSHKLQTS